MAVGGGSFLLNLLHVLLSHQAIWHALGQWLRLM